MLLLGVGDHKGGEKMASSLPARKLDEVPDAVKNQREEIDVIFLGSDWTCVVEAKGGGM